MPLKLTPEDRITELSKTVQQLKDQLILEQKKCNSVSLKLAKQIITNTKLTMIPLNVTLDCSAKVQSYVAQWHECGHPDCKVCESTKKQMMIIQSANSLEDLKPDPMDDPRYREDLK